ncbi:hypothetical protein Tco_0194461 [Tanacetum coccineum]
MAIMNSCNKHNMIACVEKTERNADFHEVIDFLTGCYVNYALLVSPDVIQQFWNTAKVRMINEVAHIEAKVAGKKILVSEASVRTDLMFNDEDGTNCFDNQVIWDTLRDIGYEGSLTLLSFSKPLFSPQWKYLVHTLLHCLSSKSSSWDQFGTNIASALVGLATNQKFNFSKLIFDGMLRNLKDSKPFLMYPRFIQLFLNKQLKDLYQDKATLSKKKKLKKAHKKKSSSFKQGRKKVSDGSTGLNEDDVKFMWILSSMKVNDEYSVEQSNYWNLHKEVEDEAGPLTFQDEGAGITIPGNIPEQERPESPTLILDPKDKEVARKIAAEWEEEEERKRFADLERLQDKLEDNEMIAAEVQRTERENFTEEQKPKFGGDYSCSKEI